MKTISTLLFLVFAISTSFAQGSSDGTEHLTFKGVPVDGTLQEFLSKMKEVGFVPVENNEGVLSLKGDFAGYKNCLIEVYTLNGKDLVNTVTVKFPEQEKWEMLSDNYFNLKELLSEKYGSPSLSFEKFLTPYEPSENDSKMHNVKFDNCKYHSNYTTSKGNVELQIDHDSWNNCFVRLTYYDKINSEEIRKKAIDDL